MKTVAVIQARTGSTRLPNKVLAPIMGKPMLSHVIERTRHIQHLDEIVIATSDRSEDDQIEMLAYQQGVKVIRGSEENVLSRFVSAIELTDADIIIRITADCPLVDPEVASWMVEGVTSGTAGYMNAVRNSGLPRGLGCEVVLAEHLNNIYQKKDLEPYHYEHVTIHILENPKEYNVKFQKLPDIYVKPSYRLTVDTPEDMQLIREIYGNLYEEGQIIDNREVIKLIDEHPELLEINSHIEQKRVGKL